MNDLTKSAYAASTPSKTDFDHETSSTLPNPERVPVSHGSVMSPKAAEEDLRSRNKGAAMDAANDVTHKENAQHPTQGGAAFAGAVAGANVIEAKFEGEAISSPDDDEAGLQFSEAEAIEIIKPARRMLVIDAERRSKRKDTPPGPSTRRTYQRKCNIVDAWMENIQDLWDTPLKVVMSHYAPKKQSFRVMHAALKWRAIARVRSQLQSLAVMQRTRLRDGSWHRCLRELKGLSSELQQVLDLDHAECLYLSQRDAVSGKSKKSLLRRLKPGWRDTFLNANEHSATYKRAGVLMRFCGLRPMELQYGVEAELTGDQLRVRIAGAKVRETAGQPWRRFSICANRLPAWFVDDLKAGKKVITANAETMRTHLARISAKLYPREYKEGQRDIILSAYVFRHALVTDLRGEGWTVDEIAAVLGESSAETANWYGLRPQSGSRDAEPSAVIKGSTETCRPVREPDRTWLNKDVLRSRGKLKRAASSRRRM